MKKNSRKSNHFPPLTGWHKLGKYLFSTTLSFLFFYFFSDAMVCAVFLIHPFIVFRHLSVPLPVLKVSGSEKLLVP